jgi:hypothetical protein
MHRIELAARGNGADFLADASDGLEYELCTFEH